MSSVSIIEALSKSNLSIPLPLTHTDTKIPSADGLSGKFFQRFKEQINLILHKHF